MTRKTVRNVMSYYDKALRKRGFKPLTKAEKAERERLAERKRIDAHAISMRAGKKPSTPLTAAQVRSRAAAKRRAGIMKSTGLGKATGLTALQEALRKKKED